MFVRNEANRFRMPREARRGAALLVELIVVTLVFGVILSTTVPLVSSALYHQRVSEQSILASQFVANLMDQLVNVHHEEFATELAAHAALPESITNELSDANMTIDVGNFDAAADPNSKGLTPITIHLTWTGRSGQAIHPIRLVGFRQTAPEDKP